MKFNELLLLMKQNQFTCMRHKHQNSKIEDEIRIFVKIVFKIDHSCFDIFYRIKFFRFIKCKLAVLTDVNSSKI